MLLSLTFTVTAPMTAIAATFFKTISILIVFKNSYLCYVITCTNTV